MNLFPKQNVSKATAFKIAGWLTWIGGFYLALHFDSVLILIVPTFIGYLLLRTGKKYSIQRGDLILTNDARPPVLYLRSFKDEVNDRSMATYFKSISFSNKKDLALTVPSSGFREQDALGYIFRKIGPYIALGKPGEDLPELGASKLYVSNEEWQNTIRDFFKKSKLIIFRAGKTEGLKWELIELLETVNPLKVIMILPVKDEDYASFIQWANLIMPTAFPVNYPVTRSVVFNEKWEPSWLPQGQTLTKSLKPFFDQNGLVIKESFWEKFLESNGIRW